MLGFENDPVLGSTGAAGIPEFGTRNARRMLEETEPENAQTPNGGCGILAGGYTGLGVLALFALVVPAAGALKRVIAQRGRSI